MERNQEKIISDVAKSFANAARLVNAGLITEEELLRHIQREIEQPKNTGRTAAIKNLSFYAEQQEEKAVISAMAEIISKKFGGAK